MKSLMQEILSNPSAYAASNPFEIMTEREKFDEFFYGLIDHVMIGDKERELMFIAWQAATKAAVPEGYKVVPIDPTEEMIVAWYESQYSEENMLSGYDAMLAAAPKV